MKRTIILTLGASVIGVAAFIAGASNQTGADYLTHTLGETLAQATSSLAPNQPGEACIYGGELFSENSIICYGASKAALVCRNDKWASVVIKKTGEDCYTDPGATISPPSYASLANLSSF